MQPVPAAPRGPVMCPHGSWQGWCARCADVARCVARRPRPPPQTYADAVYQAPQPAAAAAATVQPPAHFLASSRAAARAGHAIRAAELEDPRSFDLPPPPPPPPAAGPGSFAAAKETARSLVAAAGLGDIEVLPPAEAAAAAARIMQLLSGQIAASAQRPLPPRTPPRNTGGPPPLPPASEEGSRPSDSASRPPGKKPAGGDDPLSRSRFTLTPALQTAPPPASPAATAASPPAKIPTAAADEGEGAGAAAPPPAQALAVTQGPAAAPAAAAAEYLSRGVVAGRRVFSPVDEECVRGPATWSMPPVEVAVKPGDAFGVEEAARLEAERSQTLWIVSGTEVYRFDPVPGASREGMPVWAVVGRYGVEELFLHSLDGWWRVTPNAQEVSMQADQHVHPDFPPSPIQVIRVSLLPGEDLGCTFWEEPACAIVKEVERGSPADRAGLRAGHRVIKVGGGRGHPFSRETSDTEPGTVEAACSELVEHPLELRVRAAVSTDVCPRGHNRMCLSRATGHQCGWCGEAVRGAAEGYRRCERCGWALCNACARLPGRDVDITLPLKGVGVGWFFWQGTLVIAKLTPGSAAEQAGLRAGERILAAGALADVTLTDVATKHELDAAIHACALGPAVCELLVADDTAAVLVSAGVHRDKMPHQCSWMVRDADGGRFQPAPEVCCSLTEPDFTSPAATAAALATLIAAAVEEAAAAEAAAAAAKKKKKPGAKGKKKGDAAASPPGSPEEKKKKPKAKKAEDGAAAAAAEEGGEAKPKPKPKRKPKPKDPGD
eukprot:TRINITY_DN294_c0_g2_i1.p1 TRINITY_DN294_c0_g2~~TRINITY_DN294_c0_g2_i1.p1  ORF type:complete len:805 (+),score=200.19 TRINITY_DN294_c0_g2_i1:83-2416(+)